MRYAHATNTPRAFSALALRLPAALTTLLLTLHPAFADAPPIEAPESFFHAFTSRALPPDRDPLAGKIEAETLPAAWDPRQIVYFPIMPDARATDAVPSSGGAFVYSLRTQSLTAFGGWRADRYDGGWHPHDTKPIEIRRGIVGLAQREARLRLGAPATVVDYSAVDCVLYLHGTDSCPFNVFDQGSCRFILSAHLLPADARALSGHMQMVLGVRLRSYAASFVALTRRHDATPEAPSQSTEYRASIEADFAKVLLLDTSTGQAVAEWDAPAV